MGERERRYRRNRTQEVAERKCDFPLLPFPKDTKLTVKNIAYLCIYCRVSPQLLVSRFPKALTLADVHLGLAHYYLAKEAIDAEIKREMEFNSPNSLGDASLSLPSVGLSSLVSALKE